MELNPNNPDALNNYANWKWFQFETEGVAELYERAFSRQPEERELKVALDYIERKRAKAKQAAAEGRYDGPADYEAIVERAMWVPRYTDYVAVD